MELEEQAVRSWEKRVEQAIPHAVRVDPAATTGGEEIEKRPSAVNGDRKC